MSNRLKFFREQMAAFEGAVDPQRAIESGYYVPEPRKSVSELISRRIALRPFSTHLLLGGIGSGKTTQLLVTCERIQKEVEDIYPYYVDVSLHIDITKISVGVLTTIIGVLISRLLQDSEDETIKEDINLIKNIAYGYSEYIDPYIDSYNSYEHDHDFVYHKGILTKASHEQKSELLQAINRLDKVVAQKYGDIVFLVDGLDRLDDTESFLKLVTADLQDLSDIGVGLVIVGPLQAFYENRQETLERAVSYFDYRSCFDVEYDPDAHAFFEKILETRASEGFIEESAIQSIIHYSGGVLRDLINLAQASIEEAYLADCDNLQKSHVETSVTAFGKAKLLGVSDEELNILKNMLTENTFIPRTDEDVRLLITGRILEYRYPRRRYIVHPSILPVLQIYLENNT